MKKLLLLLTLLPASLLAQFTGGSADGEARSDAIQLDLGGVPGGIRGLYAGGMEDGYATAQGFSDLSNGGMSAIYAGGRNDGYHASATYTSISGTELANIYMGGSGDGYSYLQESQTLSGKSLEGLYSGGDGDGFDYRQESYSLGGQSSDGWFGGGDGDGFDVAVESNSLGAMLMLYGGGDGDGFDHMTSPFALSGADLQSLFQGGPGDGAALTNFAGVVPLPLTLISFEAIPNETFVLLRWVTEDEIDTDFFTIEKTRTGRQFDWVGELLAAGYSLPGEQIHYEMKDHNPYPGTSFYRLKTTDFDGQVSLSHLVEVNYDHQQDWGFKLYPNPNTGRHFNIQTQGVQEETKLLLEVFDIQGRLIQRTPYLGMDMEATAIQLQQQLAAGSYLIRLSHPDFGQQAKILLVGER